MSTKKKQRGRRGHGEGSIYQRKSDGKWTASIDLGYVVQADGTRKRKRQAIYGETRKEVADQLPALLLKRQQGMVAPDKKTVAAFLDEWLQDSVRATVRPLTAESYRQRVERYYKPYLGTIVLTKLTPAHIQKLMAAIGDLAPGTRRHIRSVLRIALNYAVRMEYIPRNPIVGVPVPRAGPPIAKILQPEEARLLLETVRGDRLEALYTVALAIGLRRGEICALRWEDVDLIGGLLHVRQTYVRVNSKLTSMPPKSDKGRRRIKLPVKVVAALKQHRFQQDNERTLAGSHWQEHGLVFTTPIGTPLALEHIGDALHKHLERAGLPRIRPHDLRHSCASLLLAQGVPPMVVKEILGHSSIRVTLDIYGHLLPEAHEDAADKMDDILGQKAS